MKNMGLVFGALAGMTMLGVGVAMLSNTKAARRRRMIKRAVKTVHNVGCAMQKMRHLHFLAQIVLDFPSCGRYT